jgi:porphobilinogen synthase
MSYAAKYASAFYGPFRDAVGASGALKGDKKTYQMDPANPTRRCAAWNATSARAPTWSWSSPACPISTSAARVKDRFGVPTYAYQVSGEYAMIEAAAANGWIDGEKVMLESLMASSARAATGC